MPLRRGSAAGEQQEGIGGVGRLGQRAGRVEDEAGAAIGGAPLPATATEEERATVQALQGFLHGGGLSYLMMMNSQPQAVGYGLTDSPAGMAGWMLVHPGFAHWSFGRDKQQSPTVDDVLDDFTLYWVTNTSASAARIAASAWRTSCGRGPFRNRSRSA